VNALTAFVTSAKAGGYWAKLSRLNLFCGDQLAAALVPLKNAGGALETNVGFVAGDYTPLAGLTGNGTSKKLDTGLSILALNKADFGMGVWALTNPVETLNNRNDIGSSYSATGNSDRLYIATRAQGSNIASFGTGNVETMTTPTTGLHVQETTGTTDQRVYVNGANLSNVSTWNNQGFNAGTMNVFSGGGGHFSPHSLAGYYIGSNLDQAALYADWRTFNLALGRPA
jgi:hypothetical protein